MMTDPKQIIVETMAKAGAPLTDDQQTLLAGSMSVIARLIEQRARKEEREACMRTAGGGRMNTEKCENCRFWATKDRQYGPSYGPCKRNPPRVEDTKYYYEGGYIVTWPITDKDDWCGQWEAKRRDE